MTLRSAITLASLAHAGQCRIGGSPFIVHPMSVAERAADAGLGSTQLQAAWLHDVPEDGTLAPSDLARLSSHSGAAMQELTMSARVEGGRHRCSVELLRLLGFGGRVVHLVDLLTRRPAETYRAYIERVCSDAQAARLKLFDIEHNTNAESTKHLPAGQAASRERRYGPARIALREAAHAARGSDSPIE